MTKIAFILIAFVVPYAANGLKITPLENPAAAGSIQPNLTRGVDGALVLSWLEPVSQGSTKLALKYSVLRGDKWSKVSTVVESENFKTHPSVPPAVTQLSENGLIAYWGQGRKPSTPTTGHAHVEDVTISISRDAGRTWSAPMIPHSDRSEVEHSFASLVPVSADSAQIVWLDGRTPGKQKLMAAPIDFNGIGKEYVLDDDVCTCCPTSTALTSKGPVAAFRDHEAGDIRDISIVRFMDGKWSRPKSIHGDDWKIAGCPINGVDLAARGDVVAAAWYTAAGETPEARVAFSKDAGETFGDPTTINSNRAVGRTSIALMNDRDALALWVEGTVEKDEAKSSTQLYAKRIGIGQKTGSSVVVSSTARGIGFPRVETCSKGAVIAWTDKSQQKSVVTALATMPTVE